MTISGISANSTLYQTSQTTFNTQRRQDFQKLSQALQSGDLSSAQQAFAQLQQGAPGVGQTQGSQQNGQNSQNGSPFSQDIAALSTALQSGDIAGAQQAFAKLQQDAKATHHAHHHRHGQAAASTQTTGTSQATTADSTSDPTAIGSQLNITA